MNVIDLGARDFKEVWDIQKALHEKRVNGHIDDTVLLVEHPPVITMGKSGKKNNLLISREALRKKNISYYEIERGGDITFHGPGQLVGYPVFNVKRGFAGIRPFIQKLQDVIGRTLSRFSIESETKEKFIGVWTKYGKICSIGIAVKQWVSYHGFALNVNNDLSYFSLIVPCGIQNVTMTSMAAIMKHDVMLGDVKEVIIESFGVLFKGVVTKRCLSELI